ncbi:MAG: hypothetical protein MUF81_18825, partial [Verrucomicrobia bacterium]|nr:hypothetical protein [Verrucomicrobiota bacterium]
QSEKSTFKLTSQTTGNSILRLNPERDIHAEPVQNRGQWVRFARIRCLREIVCLVTLTASLCTIALATHGEAKQKEAD